MKRNNQRGFTLILSLVLLLVMSLMGGSLIVISSGDHQSNNTSDEYQQTFYIAEHALVEAEKYVINEMIGPWINPGETNRLQPPNPATATDAENEAHTDYLESLTSEANLNGGFARHTDAIHPWPVGRGTPINVVTLPDTPCTNSFRNLVRNDAGDVMVSVHKSNLNFGDVIAPILMNEGALDELTHMRRYRWEYFAINVGRQQFSGGGSSIKKTTTNVQKQGTVYKVYGCGILMPKGSNDAAFENPEILIPLETLVILST